MLLDLLLISATVSVVIALLLILGPFLRRRYVMARLYLVWLLLAIRLLVPFRLELPQAPVELEILPPSGIVEQRPSAAGEAAEKPTVTVAAVLPYLWAAGAAAVLCRHAGAYWLFRLRVKPYLREEEPPRRGEPGVYRCLRIRGPMLVGYFRPMILLPEAEYTPQEREAVLTHERAHYRRGDVWYKLVLLFACSVHWFNPLVWLMVRRAAQDMEFACDEKIIRIRGAEYQKQYAAAIVKSAERSEA